MTGLRYSVSIICLLIQPVSTAFSQAGNYPDKPVTIISDSAAGSSPDVVARFVAEGLGNIWGQQVVVVNRPGANGSIAARAASEAVADGYTHLTGVLLQERANIKLVSVPYTHGPASAIGDVADGRVSMIIEGYSGIVGAVKAGQVKLIAVGSTERLPEFSDLPTIAETLPGFSGSGWQILVAPVGTPAPIVAKISADLSKVVSNADFEKKLAAFGNYPRAMNPEQLLGFVKKEQETWLPVVEKISDK